MEYLLICEWDTKKDNLGNLCTLAWYVPSRRRLPNSRGPGLSVRGIQRKQGHTQQVLVLPAKNGGT